MEGGDGIVFCVSGIGCAEEAAETENRKLEDIIVVVCKLKMSQSNACTQAESLLTPSLGSVMDAKNQARKSKGN